MLHPVVIQFMQPYKINKNLLSKRIECERERGWLGGWEREGRGKGGSVQRLVCEHMMMVLQVIKQKSILLGKTLMC
jgi:hypothetical protein